VLVDIDCDFATYYHFSIDYRSFTAESLCDDATWDPTWYVAADLDDEDWTIEAAIPLDQLTAKKGGKAPVREVWAVGVQRIVPGLGFQSWSTPASTDVLPEGFGYLIFE
jgi:hypothetical protein